MRLGFNLPQLGPAASPEAIIQVARHAEELGYDSLWVTDRLLYPARPQSSYPVTSDGSLPASSRGASAFTGPGLTRSSLNHR